MNSTIHIIPRWLFIIASCLILISCDKNKSSENPLNSKTSAPDKSNYQDMEGVWDFITEVIKRDDVELLTYLRGTLYIKNNNELKCALTTFQEDRGRVVKNTVPSEQICELYESNGVYSIKSTINKSKSEGYSADSFELKFHNKNILIGTLISVKNFDVTFIRRGSGEVLERPNLWDDRILAEQAISPFKYLYTDNEGCAFGVSSSKRISEENGLIFDVRKICRNSLGVARVVSDKSYGELRSGIYLSCNDRRIYIAWDMALRKDGSVITANYKGVDGKKYPFSGMIVPPAGSGDPVPRIAPHLIRNFEKGEQILPGAAIFDFSNTECAN